MWSLGVKENRGFYSPISSAMVPPLTSLGTLVPAGSAVGVVSFGNWATKRKRTRLGYWFSHLFLWLTGQMLMLTWCSHSNHDNGEEDGNEWDSHLSCIWCIWVFEEWEDVKFSFVIVENVRSAGDKWLLDLKFWWKKFGIGNKLWMKESLDCGWREGNARERED